MAIVYATGTLLGTAWLDIEDMAAIHGPSTRSASHWRSWSPGRSSGRHRPRSSRTVARHATRGGSGSGQPGSIAGYALFVAAISAGLVGHLVGDDLGPPEVSPAADPARRPADGSCVHRAIGALRRSHPILIAAGVLCLAQAFVSFAGVSLPFARSRVPAARPRREPLVDGDATAGDRRRRARHRARLRGVGALRSRLTETSCWVARAVLTARPIYAPIPVPAHLLRRGSVTRTRPTTDRTRHRLRRRRDHDPRSAARRRLRHRRRVGGRAASMPSVRTPGAARGVRLMRIAITGGTGFVGSHLDAPAPGRWPRDRGRLASDRVRAGLTRHGPIGRRVPWLRGGRPLRRHQSRARRPDLRGRPRPRHRPRSSRLHGLPASADRDAELPARPPGRADDLPPLEVGGR